MPPLQVRGICTPIDAFQITLITSLSIHNHHAVHKTGSPLSKWRELSLTSVCLLDTQALDLRSSLSFMCFWWGGVEVSKACHWPVQEMVQATLSLIGPLNAHSCAGTLPAAGAAKCDLNSYSWNFPAVCINMAYTCKSMADHLVANLHILAFQNVFYPQNGCLRIPTGHVPLHITPHSHTSIQKCYHSNDQSRQIFGLARTFLATYHTDYQLYWHSYILLIITLGTH